MVQRGARRLNTCAESNDFFGALSKRSSMIPNTLQIVLSGRRMRLIRGIVAVRTWFGMTIMAAGFFRKKAR